MLFILQSGCDRGAGVAATARPVVPAGTCMVDGIVTFSGPRPPTHIIGADCCPGAAPAVDESIVASPDLALANVVVFVENGPNVAGSGPAITIDQKDCTYHPHVSAARVGQTINVTSHDATLHNVHVIPELAAQDNFSETAVGAAHMLAFDKPDVVHLKCDVHPWMSAWIDVFDHPFFAVTAANGRFHIDRLPPGSYTLVTRHETLGELRQSVKIDASAPARVTFTYAGP